MDENKRTKLSQRRPQITDQERTPCAREDEGSVNLSKTKLPYDVLFLILLKLPNQSLARIKCVSKEFKAVISHPDFIALRKPSLIIQIPRRSITTSTPYFKHFRVGFPKVEEIPLEMPNHMPMDPYLIGSCHGLLCFLDFKQNGKIHYVYNSLTKEWKSSPPIESSGKRFCVLYHKTSTNTYHLLAHVLSKNNLSTRIRILDGQYKVHELGTSAWRAVSEESNPYVPLQCKQSTPVAISSCLYWICLSNKEHESRMILAFDVEMEKFSYIKEPTGVNLPDNDSEALTLVETHVGLGYPTFTEDIMHIWVMRGRDRAWEKLSAINLRPIQVSFNTWRFPCYVVLLCTMGEIWFSDHGSHTGSTNKLTIYDCNLHTFRSIDFRSLFPECFAGVINYTTCLWKSSISLYAF